MPSHGKRGGEVFRPPPFFPPSRHLFFLEVRWEQPAHPTASALAGAPRGQAGQGKGYWPPFPPRKHTPSSPPLPRKVLLRLLTLCEARGGQEGAE